MKKKPTYSRTSFLLPDKFLEAMSAIKDEEKVNKSSQVELALKIYFERYRSLLQSKEIDLWIKP